MVRLIGIDLPKNKGIPYSLTYIHGIGLTSAMALVKSANIDLRKKAMDLTADEIINLHRTLETSDLKLEGELKRFNKLNINRLSEINCYRGKRHQQNLPSRGQRTKTNARLKRGTKKTVIGKKNKL